MYKNLINSSVPTAVGFIKWVTHHLNDQINETLSVIVQLKYFGIVITNIYIAIHVIRTNIYKILSFKILNSCFLF